MKKTIILSALIAVFAISANAQLSTKERPVSFGFSDSLLFRISSSIETKLLPHLDMDAIEKEDIEDAEYDYPPRFGYSHRVDYNLDNSGTWIKLPNGDKIWHLRIVCPDALSVNLLYDKFWLPEGGKLFIYSSNRKHSIGAFTNMNNKGDRLNPQGFATGLLYGDSIILEYYQPKTVSFNAIISIAYVVHGYRYINIEDRSLGSSGSCQVNVNCSEGDNWQNEKRAVALILVNGNRYCTGSLVMTTAEDYSPLFLTANHCLGGWANVEYAGTNDQNFQYNAVNNPILNHWSFYWNYEAPGCSNISYEPDYSSTTGAIVLANNSTSDFALLRLTEDPKNVFSPYYLGWDRSGNSGTGGVGIHHPSGDVKKISTYSMTPTSNSSFWTINWAPTSNGYGTTEGGSSGSPLINNEHRVIGQLYGGSSSCNNQAAPDNYGKFSVSWTGDGTDTGRLSNWLDSIGTGQMTINGGFCLSISGPSVPESPSVYSVDNLPTGSTVAWSYSGNTLNSATMTVNSPAQNQCTIDNANKQYIKGTLTAVVTRNGVTLDTLTKDIDTGADFTGTYSQASYHYTNPNWYYHGTSATTFHSGDHFSLYKGPDITLTSNKFTGANISYLTGAVYGWSHNNNTVSFYFPYYPNNPNSPAATTITVTYPNNYKVYQFYIMGKKPIGIVHPQDKGGISLASIGDGKYVVTVSATEENTSVCDEQTTWNLSVTNSLTGEVVLSDRVIGDSYVVDTDGWKQGIYIIQVLHNKETYTQKLNIK